MISTLQEWLSANRALVLFIYGQTFFVVGLAITLQSRHRSRLNLAQSLPWLAGFGFLHGLHEWGDLFLPLQESFLSPPLFGLLRAFQLVLLAVSFACLYQFGVELLRPLPVRWRWLRFLPALTLLLWLLGPFWFGLVLIGDASTWQIWANALARYALCVPGSFLAGYGLLKQAREHIRPLNLQPIERMLRLAAASLLAYGVVGGLVVPALPVFPANILNVENFTRVFIFPPAAFRSLAGLILALAIIRALEVFDVEMERIILKMEEKQVVATERERLARDLHDGALQQVYAAGLLAQTLHKQSSGPSKEVLERLVIVINQSIEQLRRFLAQGQIEVETVELIPALEAILEETRRVLPVETRWDASASPHLNPEQINHLTAFTREALSNAIRHAQTDRVELLLQCADNRLRLSIRDFGRGLPEAPEPGYGLRNMRDRARMLDADLHFESAPGQGTTVILEMSMEEKL